MPRRCWVWQIAPREKRLWLTPKGPRALLSDGIAVEPLRTSIQLEQGLVLGRSSGRLVMHSEGQELLLSDQLCYVPRLAGDELRDGSLRWGIDRRHKDAVCEMVARHRLGLPEPENPGDAPPEHPYLLGAHTWWKDWLGKQCEADETLLASLPTGEVEQILSAYDGRESVDVYWVWTSHRVFLAYAGRLGDVVCHELSLPVRFERGVLKGTLHSGELQSSVSGKHAKTIELMQSWANQDPWLWHASVVVLVLGAQGQSHAQALEKSPGYQDDEALDLVYPLWRDVNHSEPVTAKKIAPSLLLELWSRIETHAGLEIEPPNEVKIPDFDAWLDMLDCESLLQDKCFAQPWPLGRMLARLCLAWAKSEDEQKALVTFLDKMSKNFKSIESASEIESSLARGCVFACLYQTLKAEERAYLCYQELMQVLPGPQDLELVLGQEDAHAPLRHLLDALVQTSRQLWPAKSPEGKALLERSASLVPLELARLQAWIEACEPQSEQQARLEQVTAQLKGLGHPRATSLPATPVHPLRPADIESRLVHPAARFSKSASLQAMLAKLDRPDHSALKKYCDPGQEGVLAKEIDRVAQLFEKERVDVFISHGDRRYGVQAFEGEPAFLLVGGEHRRPESPVFLEEDELRFTLGAELAHLYLGHARVTSQEVLSGAFDKGKMTFEVLTSVVPLLSAFPWGRRLGQLAGYFDNKLVSRSAKRIRDYFGSGDAEASNELTLDRSVGLIAAHRMMQLTADRAGLLCAGDLGASIVAMWKIRPESLEYLDLLRSDGVTAAAKALAERDNDLWRSLSTRASALTSFAWSSEYQELRSWCW